MFDLAVARSESLSWNRAWGQGSPGATGDGGQRPGRTAGAGRPRAAQDGCRPLAGVGEGFPVVLSEMATAAGNALGENLAAFFTSSSQPGSGPDHALRRQREKEGTHRQNASKGQRLLFINLCLL